MKRRRFPELLTMGGRIFYQTHWAPLLQMQGSVSEVKLHLKHADGTVVPMVFNATRRERDGRSVDTIAAFVARDRDKYEQELVKARNRLQDLVAETSRLHAEEKDRALFAEQMIAIVSHDLRNPLSTIRMAAQLLRMDGTAEDKTLDRVVRATDRANNLIATLLDFTRARLGRGIPVAPAEIALHRCIDEGLADLRVGNPSMMVMHSEQGEGRCIADAGRLIQLVGNLVSNAAAYGERGRLITVTSRIDETTFSVEVHNWGTPIPAEVQSTIFHPMTRGPNALATKTSIGLGLFIVSAIAKAHGGSTFVRSNVADGTTFGATFPRDPVTA